MQHFYFKVLGIAVAPKEIEDNAYVNFWPHTRCIMGDVQMANRPTNRPIRIITQIWVVKRQQYDIGELKQQRF